MRMQLECSLAMTPTRYTQPNKTIRRIPRRCICCQSGAPPLFDSHRTDMHKAWSELSDCYAADDRKAHSIRREENETNSNRSSTRATSNSDYFP